MLPFFELCEFCVESHLDKGGPGFQAGKGHSLRIRWVVGLMSLAF
jgi:hypothetical protein